jgi:hypothetical protein
MKRKFVNGFLAIVMLLFHTQGLLRIPGAEFRRNAFNNILDEAFVHVRPQRCAFILYEKNA